MTAMEPAAVLALWLVAAGPQAAPVARVNGVAISAARLEARVAATRAAGGDADPALLVEDLVNEELLAVDGYRQKLERAPAVVAAFEAEQRRQAAERHLEQDVFSTLRLDEAQVRAMFHETGDSARVELIVLATEAEARATLGRLAQGASFADEAKSSLDPTLARKGGAMGLVTRGQLDEPLRAPVFAAAPGEPFGPVKLALGFGVGRVLERALADEQQLPARRAQIEGFVMAQGRTQLKAHYLQQLRAKAKVAVDEAFLAGTGARIDATPEEAERAVAVVGGRRVRYGDVLAAMLRTFGRSQGSHVSGPSVKKELAWREVDDQLLADAALQAGHGRAPEVLAKAKEAEREGVIRELAQRLRQAVPTPSGAELDEYLAQHLEEYRAPARRSCSHLVVRRPEQAQELLERLRKGAALEELAAQYSTDAATAKQGGLIGEVDEPGLTALAAKEPALAAALRGAPGAVAGPVQSSAGYHLVRCGPQKPGALPPREALAGPLLARALRERGDAAVRAKVAELRRTAKVELSAAAPQGAPR